MKVRDIILRLSLVKKIINMEFNYEFEELYKRTFLNEQ